MAYKHCSLHSQYHILIAGLRLVQQLYTYSSEYFKFAIAEMRVFLELLRSADTLSRFGPFRLTCWFYARTTELGLGG